jgi:branched-chain amino acid transport system ATP-binding protein
MPLLSIEDLHAGYGGSDVLTGVSLAAQGGTVTALVGANGAGKTTTLRAVVGQIRPTAGTIRVDGSDLVGLSPHEVYRRGVTLVPEDRGIFPDLTVDENLRVPVVEGEGRSRAELYETFPELSNLRTVPGSAISGGEQQLLAIARTLRQRPRLLLLDEPSEGLAPQAVERVVDVVEDIVDAGTTVLLVEQNVGLAFDLARTVSVIDDGRIVTSGTPDDLRGRDEQLRTYLGLSRSQVSDSRG